jgi:mannose-6-phosphate isomerase-like protein (cupin superfamily)
VRRFVMPTRTIDVFDSTGVTMDFLPRVHDASDARVHVARLQAGGTLGRHPATLAQFFAVLDGSGEVADSSGMRVPIVAGQAALWEVGEEHQTWASTPMVAVIVETTGSFDLNDHFVELLS